MEKAVRDGNAPAGVTATPDKPAAAIKSSENPETRLQVRRTGLSHCGMSLQIYADFRSDSVQVVHP